MAVTSVFDSLGIGFAGIVAIHCTNGSASFTRILKALCGLEYQTFLFGLSIGGVECIINLSSKQGCNQTFNMGTGQKKPTLINSY